MSRMTRRIGLLSLIMVTLGCTATRSKSSSDDTGTNVDSDSDSDVYNGPPIPLTCEDAALARTSVGCEFYMVDMDNYDDHDEGETWTVDHLPFSVVVSNPQQDQDAWITVQDGAENQLADLTIQPGQLEVIDLTCQSGCLAPPAEIDIQGIGHASGFRLTADVPITAYQWNTYGQNMHSSDASLLLPVTSLSNTYIVASWPTNAEHHINDSWSQMTIVATENNTSVTIVPSIYIEFHGGIGPLLSGTESTPFILDTGDVLTLRTGVDWGDLTGSKIIADKVIAVFGGNSCANVPHPETCCCDHIEEQLFPLEAWGTATVLARTEPRPPCSMTEDTGLWRIVAGADDMNVTFDPPVPPPYGGEHHFEFQGDFIEFQSPGDHFAVGFLDDPPDPLEPEAAFLAYQVMSGASFISCLPGDQGDPMLLLSAPAGQYLDRYVFNTDNVFDFKYDHIVVVRQSGIDVELDCLGTLPDDGFEALGGSGWEVGRFYLDHEFEEIACIDGAHLISSEEPFGLSVVGTDHYHSYGYLGGVGVRQINPYPVIE